MLVTAIATLILAQGATTVCPIMGKPSPADAPALDYNGVRYTICCGGCAEPFKADPQKALKSEKLKGQLVGVSLFDPVTGARIEAKDAKGGSSDFGGVRYYFATAEGKKAFDADPKKFATTPEKEALHCILMDHGIKDYASAGGYVEHDKTRYYVCCMDCAAEVKKDPAKFASKAKGVKAPKVLDAPKKKG